MQNKQLYDCLKAQPNSCNEIQPDSCEEVLSDDTTKKDISAIAGVGGFAYRRCLGLADGIIDKTKKENIDGERQAWRT